MLAPRRFLCLGLKGRGLLLVVRALTYGNRLTHKKPRIVPRLLCISQLSVTMMQCPKLLAWTGEMFRWLLLWKIPLRN